MRILFLSTLLPGLRRTGSEVATQSFVDALRKAGHDVTLLAYRRVNTDPPIAPDDVAAADRHIETLGAGVRPAFWMLRAIATGRPYSVAKYVGRAYRRAMDDAHARLRPELIVLDHAQMAWLIPAGGWDVPTVYLAHNVEHALHDELSEHGGPRSWAHRREARKISEVERSVLKQASALWTLARTDAEALGALAPQLPARVFDIPPVTVPDSPGKPVHDVVTLGGWHWKPNAAGLRWFVEEVAPHLEGRGLDVVVGGHSGEEIVGAQAGIRPVGQVPDALEFLQSGRLVAVPSTAGAGVQVKTLDAIASGRRVVATSIAMRGIGDPPDTVRTADDPAEFANAIINGLHEAVDEQAGEQARDWASRRTERFQADVRDAAEAARSA
ncbi:MAG: glycosyltransferase [Thermoleophilaceae bacterium]